MINLNRSISRYPRAKKEQNTTQLRKEILAKLKENKSFMPLLFSGRWKERIFSKTLTKVQIKIHF